MSFDAKSFAQKLNSDANLRRAFGADPKKVLADEGLTVSDEDAAGIREVMSAGPGAAADPTVATIMPMPVPIPVR
ncbi:hypothetical protein [Salinarimonas rosea]|uniref:hypothetical protein n=1 Tax=Salinarimonas rosea TaxID=552063 RepID=UPI0003F9A1EB|nr:hypothetical protein [Salinarimonas rosea]